MAHRLVKSFSGTFGFTHLVFTDARHGFFVEDQDRSKAAKAELI
jgi:hypothetical protein